MFITKPDSPQTLYVGKQAEFRCEIRGSAPLNVVWLKDNEPTRFQSSYEGNKVALEIPCLEPSDGGTYVCKVSNDVGSAECLIGLKVVDKPQFVKPLGAMVAAMVGAPLHLECTVDEDSGTSFTWSRNGKKVHQSPDCKLSFERKTVALNILKTTLRDCGEYVCTVTNEAGSASCSTAVKIQGKSYLLLSQTAATDLDFQNTRVYSGSLHCAFSSFFTHSDACAVLFLCFYLKCCLFYHVLTPSNLFRSTLL